MELKEESSIVDPICLIGMMALTPVVMTVEYQSVLKKKKKNLQVKKRWR